MWEIIQSGGPMMVPLTICAIMGLAYTIERIWVLRLMPESDQAKAQLDELEAALERSPEAAVEQCSQGKGGLNYVFSALLKRHTTLMIEQREFQATHQEIVDLAESAGGGDMGRCMVMLRELEDLKTELVVETEESAREYLGKNLVVLFTIGNISPLLGLLGTIMGMIIAFESIAVAGAGDPRVVAGGISQALVTTASGLIVAIPSIVIYRFLARWADRSLKQVEVYGHAFANTLIMSTRNEPSA